MARILVLNGASSSGKSTLARALQERSDEVLLHFSIDTILYTLPPRQLQRLMSGEELEGVTYDSLVTAYYACLRQLADLGHAVISDNAITARRRAEELVRAVDGHDVVLVGLECSGAVLAEREAARGDRRPGLALAQSSTIHKWLAYDVVVDTAAATPDENAAAILGATIEEPRALDRTKQLLGVRSRQPPL